MELHADRYHAVLFAQLLVSDHGAGGGSYRQDQLAVQGTQLLYSAKLRPDRFGDPEGAREQGNLQRADVRFEGYFRKGGLG